MADTNGPAPAAQAGDTVVTPGDGWRQVPPWFHCDGDPDAVPTLVEVHRDHTGAPASVILDSGDGLTFTVRLSDRLVTRMSDWNRFWGYPLMRRSNRHSGRICEGCDIYIGPLPEPEALAAVPQA